MAKKKLLHRREAIVQALKTVAPNSSPSQLDAELKLLLAPNSWTRWIPQNDRLDAKQKAVLERYSSRPSSHQIIYKGPDTTALNLERAVLDAGARTASSPNREQLYNYVGFGKGDVMGKATFELGIKAKCRGEAKQASGAPYPSSKPKNVLKDYGIEDSEASTSSDSDGDIDDSSSEDADSERVEGEGEDGGEEEDEEEGEVDDEEEEDSDGSEDETNEVPIVPKAIPSNNPKQTERSQGSSSPRDIPRNSALPSRQHAVKRSRPAWMDHTAAGLSRKKRREMEDAWREAESDLRDDTYDYNGNLSDDDHDGGMFGGMFGQWVAATSLSAGERRTLLFVWDGSDTNNWNQW